MGDLVSILIPAFNAERWIGDCIKSAVTQTWPEKEIIVVDDGSEDRSHRIASKFHPMVQVVQQEHRGACAARNTAFSIAQGDYIQWLDADDLLACDKIEKQMRGAEPGRSSDILLSCPWGGFMACPERARFSPSLLWQDLDPVEWLFRKIKDGLWMAPETWLVSRNLSEKAGPWNEELARDQDGEYFCRVLGGATHVRFVPEARVYKRVRIAGSISAAATVSDKKRDSTFISLQSHLGSLLAAEDSDRTRNACLKALDHWSIYFYPERVDLLCRLQSIAEEIGGRLPPPRLCGKYRVLQVCFGWRTAKKAKIALPLLRDFAVLTWERILCVVVRLRNRGRSSGGPLSRGRGAEK
jgi:glycosyltransferase involved in cell wall biosynthesis